LHISHPFFLFFAALLGGLVNSVAGGGSFISFPALLFTGMPAIPANATNTMAMWPGTLASTLAYRNAFTPDARRLFLPLVLIGIVGGVLGAFILLRTPPATFLHLIPWLLLVATLLFVFSGQMTAWVRGRAGQAPSESGDKMSDAKTPDGQPSAPRVPRGLMITGLLLELVVAVYVGYFGAGAGILMLSILAILGLENIHTLNGMKTLLVSVVNGVAIITFIVGRVIVWPQALLMLVGAVIGGYGGAYVAQKMNPQHVRWIVIVIGFAMSAYFFIKY
jgi:uncharacterized protein